MAKTLSILAIFIIDETGWNVNALPGYIQRRGFPFWRRYKKETSYLSFSSHGGRFLHGDTASSLSKCWPNE